MAIFGYNVIGGTSSSENAAPNVAELAKGVPTYNGLVSKISAYVRDAGQTADVKGVIWRVSDLAVHAVSSVVNDISSVASWVDLNFIVQPSVIAGEEYYVGFMANEQFTRYYDNLAPGSGGWDAGNSFASPAALSLPFNSTAQTHSAYATYSIAYSFSVDYGSFTLTGEDVDFRGDTWKRVAKPSAGSYTDISKPTSSLYTRLNPQGKEQYDQSSIEYDESGTYYDTVNTTAYTNVSKPS